ncbi:MAG: alpha-amylase family glycosyl hydrolase [Bacteroidota bacterium]
MSLQKSQAEGMLPFGATLTERGIGFRVWAPHADAVSVVGSFNGWDDQAHRLDRHDDGTWSGTVRGAKVGDGYLFALRNEAVSDDVLRRPDPYARQMVNSASHSVVYDPAAFDWEGDSAHCPPWNDLVIYELHVGTFAGFKDGRPGDLHAAARRLGYLRDLGVNAVEVMPLAEFGGDVSWGYNPAAPFAVESSYGGPDAFKAFVKEAHRHGIAVILDVVYNHFGPSDLGLWQFDGWSEHGQGGIYFYNDHRRKTPWGDTRPDYGRPEVQQFLLDNAAMWLEEYHVDGLRVDMTPYVYTVDGGGDRIEAGWQFLQRLTTLVRERFPGRIAIAEDLHTNHAITQPVEQGGAGFGSQWDAQFVHPIRGALITPDDGARDLGRVAAALQHRYGSDAFARVVYTESHDEVANGKARIAEEIFPGRADSWASKKRATLGAALALTAPGIPMLFQGQALLDDGYFQDTVPLDWKKAKRHDGLVQLHRDLIALRRDFDGTATGLKSQHLDLIHVDHHAKLLAYQRRDAGGPNDSVFVVVNLSHRAHYVYPLRLPHDAHWHLRFNSDGRGYDRAFGGHPAYDLHGHRARVSIGPYTVLVYTCGTAPRRDAPRRRVLGVLWHLLKRGVQRLLAGAPR